MITEMDVIDQSLPLDVAVRDRSVADFYKKYLSCVLEEPAVVAVLNWGLSDRYTWISYYAPRADHTAVRPLPLDRYMVRKPCWQAIAQSFTARS